MTTTAAVHYGEAEREREGERGNVGEYAQSQGRTCLDRPFDITDVAGRCKSRSPFMHTTNGPNTHSHSGRACALQLSK